MVTAGRDKRRRFIYVCDPSYARTTREEKANAKLICAAPDLLAALEHCAEALKAIGSSRGLVADHGDALDEALRAIDKAKGTS